MQSFMIIGLLVLWAWWPTWSCDLDHLYIISFCLPKEALHKIDLIVNAVLEKKIFENGGHAFI